MGLSAVFLTAVGVFAFAGALFAVLYFRGRGGDARLAAALCLGSCAVTFELAKHPAYASLDSRVFLVLSFAFVAHLGLRGARAHPTPAARRATHGWTRRSAARSPASRARTCRAR
jgi:hypothetical protein